MTTSEVTRHAIKLTAQPSKLSSFSPAANGYKYRIECKTFTCMYVTQRPTFNMAAG